MAFEDDITHALDRRFARSGAQTPTLERIADTASADVVVLPDREGDRGDARRGVYLAVAAAVVLVALVGGALVLGNRGGEQGQPFASGPPTSETPSSVLDPRLRDDDIVNGCQVRDHPTWIVFFEPEADEEEIIAVRRIIGDLGERTEYFDQAAAYHEFSQLFADSPEMIDTVTPDILPTSTRVWSSTVATPPAEIATMVGVRQAVTC